MAIERFAADGGSRSLRSEPFVDTNARMKFPPTSRSLPLIAVLGSAALAFAQPNLTEVTRQPDAYDAWKLALTPGAATDPATITVPAGFKIELLRSATAEEDSWVAMAFDPQGRLTIAREKQIGRASCRERV